MAQKLTRAAPQGGRKSLVSRLSGNKWLFKDRKEMESQKVSTLKNNKSFHSMYGSGRMIRESGIHDFHIPECLSVRADPASLWQSVL